MEVYYPKGVCSSCVAFEVENETIKHVEFMDGCEGNLKAIALLVQGLHIDKVISLLEGIDCCDKGTSCPDQFSKALKQYKNKLKIEKGLFYGKE